MLAHVFSCDPEKLSKEEVRAARAVLAYQAALTPPEEPDRALLVSMAMRLDHGFGLATPERQESRLRDMRKLWEEVVGRGYYSPDNRERYVSMLAARPEVPDGRG
jgi:hypothetical protein